MTFEMREILKSKQAMSRRLAALPLVEKLRLLDRLRERSLRIAASRVRRKAQEPRGGPMTNPADLGKLEVEIQQGMKELGALLR